MTNCYWNHPLCLDIYTVQMFTNLGLLYIIYILRVKRAFKNILILFH